MPWKFTIRLAELLITAILATALIAAWRADRNDRAKLAAELATAKQSLAQADERQHTRDSQLLQTLATLSADKRQITTPTQIIRALPQYLDLPAPITLQTQPNQAATKNGMPGHASAGSINSSPNSTNSPNDSEQTQAVIPAADLKPSTTSPWTAKPARPN